MFPELSKEAVVLDYRQGAPEVENSLCLQRLQPISRSPSMADYANDMDNDHSKRPGRGAAASWLG